MKLLLALLTLACIAGIVFVPFARGEEGPQAAADAWRFDVRMVRVDTPTPEAVEVAAPWDAAGPGTITTPWPEVLKQLRARGRTTLLLDQSITALGDAEALVTQTRDRLIQQLQSRDLSNERYGAAPIVTGGTAKLRVSESTVLQYQVEARWEIRSGDESVRSLLCTSKWAGTFPAIPDGRTLVLTYREQVETWGESRVGQEIHVFVTARRVPAR
jgi:hypothetical protein